MTWAEFFKAGAGLGRRMAGTGGSGVALVGTLDLGAGWELEAHVWGRRTSWGPPVTQVRAPAQGKGKRNGKALEVLSRERAGMEGAR